MGEGVGKNLPRFLHAIGRAETGAAFFRFCREFPDHGRPMPLEPGFGGTLDAGQSSRLSPSFFAPVKCRN